MSQLILFLYVITTSMGLVVLKLGTKSGVPVSLAHSKLSLNLNLYIISGIALYGISFLLYMYLIAKNDLGYIIPLTAAFVYIIVFVASYVIFHEAFTPTKIMAVLLILSGLILLNTGK